MIPILYEKDETLFIRNGLGRLRDCISCIVTEERNGIYECDFEYPTTGAHFDQIQVGRIIGVTHDDSEDVQPFDIVSYSKPINGVVKFHCVHISYRQNYMSITGSDVNSLAMAFRLVKQAQPNNPFSYETDKDNTGYLGAADGMPHTVRQILGGLQGSILDTYNGEYEWDKWTVRLWASRGQIRDFTIRYGLNMLDYNEEFDIQGTYSSCLPYWTDGAITVLGNRVESNGSTITGRGECVPLDLSDKFEEMPTMTELESMASTYMNANRPFIPTQNIHVEFARLQDLGYEEYGSLLECNLCDTITVVFPDYNGSAQYKIVKTTWDVLRDRYESMELGDLSVTLAEALGITQDSSDRHDSFTTSAENGKAPLINTNGVIELPYILDLHNSTLDYDVRVITTTTGTKGQGTLNIRCGKLQFWGVDSDYIVEQGTSGIWTYRKWNSGVAECWGIYSHSFTGMTAWGSLYYSTPSSTVNFPTNLFVSAPTTEISRSGGVEGWAGINTVETSRLFGMYLIRPTTNDPATTQFHIYARGKWK